jgi:hypothetical protein
MRERSAFLGDVCISFSPFKYPHFRNQNFQILNSDEYVHRPPAQSSIAKRPSGARRGASRLRLRVRSKPVCVCVGGTHEMEI